MPSDDFYTDKYPTQLLELISGGVTTLHSHAGGAAIPAGIICMWSGLLTNIPSGWALCDGAGGRPDLRSKFIKGSAAGIDPGVTGGSATHTHDDHPALTHTGGAVDAHSGAGVDAHSAHSGAGVDAHSAHSGAGVDAHSGAGVDAHSAHSGGAVGSIAGSGASAVKVGTSASNAEPTGHTHPAPSFTQPSGHANHVFTQAANHVFTQAANHANHVFTQAANHANHVFTQAANHVFTQPNQHAAQSHVVANNEPVFYSLAFIIKT
jgi:hypothetical protein